MSQTGTSRQSLLSGRDRLVAIVLAVGCLALLTAAALVDPDPGRRGTHQQFGLPPCAFRVAFGRPCPTCGMTTAWSHVVRGQLMGALRTNVGGTMLGVLAVIATPWLLASAARGRWLGWIPNSAAVAWMAAAVVVVTLIDWGLRLLAG